MLRYPGISKVPAISPSRCASPRWICVRAPAESPRCISAPRTSTANKPFPQALNYDSLHQAPPPSKARPRSLSAVEHRRRAPTGWWSSASVAMSTTVDAAAAAIEAAKRAAAIRAVADHFDATARYVGIGSGSTIVYVVEAIQALRDPRVEKIQFVPTGYQSRQVIYNAGLRDIKYDSLPRGALIDVAFDGADEVDEELNCIKGGGACLYQEKLVATRAKKFVCVAGASPPTPPNFHPLRGSCGIL